MWQRTRRAARQVPKPCLFVKNVVVLSFCLVALTSFYDRFDRTKQTFLRLHRQIVGVHPYKAPVPCALATPSAAELTVAVGRFPRTPWVEDPTEEMAYDVIESSLCGADTIHRFLKHLSRNKSLVTAADVGGTTYDGAEASLVNMLCDDDFDTRRHVYGDIRTRITRAYMHSNAAFVKYATGCWTTPTKPFSAGMCGTDTATLVTEHMNAAAVDTLVAGQADAATFPETGDMLARLLMLAAISEADRSVNGGACFGNPLALNASRLCAATYAERIGAAPLFDASVSPPAPAPVVSGIPYEDVMRSYGRTCGDSSVALSDPPAPPPIPAFVWNHPENDDPAVLACTHTLTFGLLDQRRLFGVPDPRDLFAVETNWANFLSGLLYSSTGLGLLDDGAWEERQNSLQTRLLLYAAYRLAAITALCTLAGVSLGFFTAWAGVPLFVFLVSFSTGKTDVFGMSQRAGRPTPGISFWLMVLVAFVTSSWAIFVEPPTHMSPHYTDQSCAARKDTSAPWATTSVGVGASERWIVYIPFAATAYAVIYAWFIRGGKCNPQLRKRMANLFRIANARPSWMGSALLTQMLVIYFLLLGAGASGAAWFAAAIKKRQLVRVGVETAELVANDCLVVAVGSIFVGACIGALCTRWSVTKEEAIAFKVPYLIALFGCCFFPVLLQLSLAITQGQGTPGREQNFWYSLFAQAATGGFALLSVRLFVSVPPTADTATVPVIDPSTLLPETTPPLPATLKRQGAFVRRWPITREQRSVESTEPAMDAEQRLPLLYIK